MHVARPMGQKGKGPKPEYVSDNDRSYFPDLLPDNIKIIPSELVKEHIQIFYRGQPRCDTKWAMSYAASASEQPFQEHKHSRTVPPPNTALHKQD